MGRLHLAGFVLAGGAALFAPSPWSWIGVLGAAVGFWLGWIQARSADERASRDRRKLQALDADLEEVRKGDSLHTALLAVLSAGVVAFAEGRAVYANPAAVDMLGERVVAEGGPLPPEIRSVLARASEGHESVGEIQVGYPTRVLQAVGSPPDEDGITVLRLIDVTERRRVDEIRRDFVAAASHELKTPAAAIQAAAETVLMALDDDPDAVRSFSARIHDNATRLSRIVTDLLDLSRLETHVSAMEPLDLTRLVADEVGKFGSSKPPIVMEGSPVPVLGNRADLALAIRNLLDNAVRYTPADGHIDVRVAADGPRVSITVSDDGPGIPAADLPRVFERFYRVDEARSRATGGTGLGLSIVKHVVELHGGEVSARSEVGLGSSFRITLPIASPS